MFATDRPSHPGSGNGNLPVTGVVGIVIAILAIAVFGVLWLRNRSVRERQLTCMSSRTSAQSTVSTGG